MAPRAIPELPPSIGRFLHLGTRIVSVLVCVYAWGRLGCGLPIWCSGGSWSWHCADFYNCSRVARKAQHCLMHPSATVRASIVHMQCCRLTVAEGWPVHVVHRHQSGPHSQITSAFDLLLVYLTSRDVLGAVPGVWAHAGPAWGLHVPC